MDVEVALALGRRSTRAALAEIPARLGQLRVSPPPAPEAGEVPPPLSPATPRHALTPNTRDNTPAETSSAFLSPTPSPDELVIQQRGRKRIPATWSPDIESRRSIFQPNTHTPSKSPLNLPASSRNGITLRPSPKKRLLLNEFDHPTSPKKANVSLPTPTKTKNVSPSKSSPTPKRLKIEHRLNGESKLPLEVTLKGMSHDQLIDIISTIAQRHPDIESEIRAQLPPPDLKPLVEKLVYLKRNIFRSLPTSRLTSRTDSPAYSRAATHLLAFKKQLVEQGRQLVESQHWPSVAEYVTSSWTCVRATPLWDNQPHNVVRRQCFKYLAGLLMNALKKGQFDGAALRDLYETMEGMSIDSDDIQTCLKWVDVQLKSA